MKIANTKLKKTIIIVISFIIVTVVVVILLISPITKFLIEKYDEKYTGRQIKMDWVYLNPFTGYIHIRNLKIFESNYLPDLINGDSIFFSARGLSVNFALYKLKSKTIEITELTLDNPKGTIIQNIKNFNFDDLIKKFTPEKTDTTPSDIHFNILKIKIKNGQFYYRKKTGKINYFIKEVNIESTGICWNIDTLGAKFSFYSGSGSGNAKGNFTINFKNSDYRFAAIADKFDLKFIEQYLKDLVNYGSFSANLDADIKATGNFSDQENINSHGLIAINDFHFGKNKNDDYVSFDKLILSIDELSPKNHKYIFDSILLFHPYFKYERYDYLDNLEMMFGKNGANISTAKANSSEFNLILEIADYIKVLSKNFFQSDYKINKLAVYKGNLKFNDYSNNEKFSIAANPLNIFADSVNKNHKRVNISLVSGILPYGNMSVTLSINPKDTGDFDMQYNLTRLPASLFNPYLVTYTSFPLDRGTLELNGTWKVRNGIIQSDNHLLVIDPRLTRRIRNKGSRWIPLPLVMFFVRENGNVIDYEIPITGKLKNPKFHLKDVILDILGNIFVKPPTTPYRNEVKYIENEIEKSLTLKWEMRQCSLKSEQERFVNKMVDFLINNPDASIDVYPYRYAEKEKECILFFEAKKKYLFPGKNSKTLSENDSMKVEKMSIKDTLFVQYLDKHLGKTLLFTIQDKCEKFVGNTIINTKFQQLNKDREEAFILQFKKKSVEKRIKIYPGENNIPYNGFSYYKIAYKSELPETLIRANQQMSDLNKEAPRKRFLKIREKIKKVIK